VCRCASVLVCRCACGRCAGVLVCRCACGRVCRSAGARAQDTVPSARGHSLTPRHGQRVTSAPSPEDLPFSPATGMVPDLVINPHAFPTRMTVGQLFESRLWEGEGHWGHTKDHLLARSGVQPWLRLNLGFPFKTRPCRWPSLKCLTVGQLFESALEGEAIVA